MACHGLWANRGAPTTNHYRTRLTDDDENRRFALSSLVSHSSFPDTRNCFALCTVYLLDSQWFHFPPALLLRASSRFSSSQQQQAPQTFAKPISSGNLGTANLSRGPSVCMPARVPTFASL